MHADLLRLPLWLTALLVLCIYSHRVIEGVGDAGADELLQHGFSDGHHHSRGGRVAQPHREKNRTAHEPQNQPTTQTEHMQVTESIYNCTFMLNLLNTYMPGLAPAIMTIRRAMRLCRFHFSMEAARQITPISNSVVSLKYSEATCKHSLSEFLLGTIWTFEHSKNV